MTRSNLVHTYPATSGSGIAYGSNNTAGNLLIVSVKDTNATAASITDTIGDTWLSYDIKGGGNAGKTLDIMKIFYCLNAKAGANTVTVTVTGTTDLGTTMLEVNGGGGGTWAVDVTSGAFTDGFVVGVTAAQVTNAFNTSGADDYIYVSFGDEANTQASHTATPAGFSEIQWDNTHVDADLEGLDRTAQSGTQAGWNVASAHNSWSLYQAAFTFTASAGTTPTNFVVIKGSKVSTQGALITIK